MRRSLVFTSIALGLFASASVACAPSPRAPGADTSPWSELRSDHFVVRTNMPAADGDAIARELETVHAVLTQGLYRGLPAMKPVQVVVFASEDAYREVAPDGTAGIFTRQLPNDLDEEPTFVTWGQLDDDRREVVIHELVHAFNHEAFGALPTWLDEGLAEYLSTVSLAAEEGATFGRVPLRLAITRGDEWIQARQGGVVKQFVPIRELPSADALMEMTPQAFYEWSEKDVDEGLRRRRQARYAAAFALVHLFFHGPAKYGDRFAQAVQKARTKNVAGAFREAFADLAPGELDAALERYLLETGLPLVRRPAGKPSSVRTALRTMTVGEAELLRARMFEAGGPEDPQARSHLARATQAGLPPEVLGFWQGRFAAKRGDGSAALSAFDSGLRVAPSDRTLLFGRASLLAEPPRKTTFPWPDAERVRAAEAAVEALRPVAQTAREHAFLSRWFAARGDAQRALSHGRRSTQLDHACGPCLLAMGDAYLVAGRPEDAATWFGRALERLPESTPAEVVRHVRRALEEAKEDARKRSAPNGDPRRSTTSPASR